MNPGGEAIRPGWGYALARGVSAVGHPFALATGLMVLGATKVQGAAGLPAALLALALTVAPCGLFAWWRVRTGAWENLDASRRQQRPALYALGLGLMGLLLAVTLANPRMGYMTRPVEATLLVILLGLALNVWIKVSMHATFAAFVGTLALPVSPAYAAALLLALPLIGWARLRLGRHTLPEVLLGAALGLGVGLGTVR